MTVTTFPYLREFKTSEITNDSGYINADNIVEGDNITKTVSDGNIRLSATDNELPSQTGNSGKFLTTNGTAVSWATITIPTFTYDSTTQTLSITTT